MRTEVKILRNKDVNDSCHTIGDYFLHKNSGVVYILACVDLQTVSLISVHYGNRYAEPVVSATISTNKNAIKDVILEKCMEPDSINDFMKLSKVTISYDV